MPVDSNHVPKILIVEDELKIAELLRDYLSQSGYACTHVDNGIDAVPKAAEVQPDLILLDVMLPGQDGLEVCRAVRRTSDVPIIMVTARSEEIDRLLGLELGADDYIVKPFSPREVVARVKAVLRRIRMQSEQPAAEAPGAPPPLLDLDEESYIAKVRGERLDLTPTEFRLLHVLASRHGRVFSRSQLLELVYEDASEVVDRVIDSHIKNLRRKIAKVLPDVEVIHSVYGVGYRFESDE